MIKSNTAPTTHEACPLCGQLAAVQPLPENPFMLFYTCPGCGFHDRWLTPTPADIPITTLLSYLQTTEAGSLHAAILAELDRRSREDGMGTSDMPASPQANRAIDDLDLILSQLIASELIEVFDTFTASAQADTGFDPEFADTGYVEACAACGAGVRVYRHHTVDLEGYLCQSCGHESARRATTPPAEREYWQTHEQVIEMLEQLPALVDAHAERAGNDNFAPDWAADLCHLQGQLALLVAYLEVNQDLS